MGKIILADNLDYLKTMPDGSVNLIYIDPPFNTGKVQQRRRIKIIRDDETGDRIGFQGKAYKTVKLGTSGYNDKFDDFIGFLEPRLNEAHRILAPTGSLFFHIDYREVHYCKRLLDEIFGRESFINEIIWQYDYGARSKNKWSAKHDNILWYAKNPTQYTFNFKEIERVPYMAPGLAGPEKAARGKTLTDVWWHTIVPTNGKEKTGYATQKPLGIIKRIVEMHSKEGDLVIDFFAGSGTTGEAAALLNRDFILVDSNPEAIKVMQKRLEKYKPEFVNFEPIKKHLKPNKIKRGNNIKHSTHVKIIAIGVENYEQPLNHLSGPKKDVDNIYDLLIKSKKTALYKKHQFIKIINPTAAKLRNEITKYVYDRSASGDILLLYFSGHGSNLVTDGFGFCTIDTKIHDKYNAIIPTSIVKFSEIISAITMAEIIPVVIIDACCSGAAGYKLMESINQKMADTGKCYALLCSCSDTQESHNTNSGGVFTNALINIAKTGIDNRERKLGFSEIYHALDKSVKGLTDTTPRLYISPFFPDSDFSFIKNTQFEPQRITFAPYMKKIIIYLWNKGTPKDASRDNLSDFCRKGAYGNWNKLSYVPWSLVEERNKKIQLTEKGKKFARGKISIPLIIEKEKKEDPYIYFPVPKTRRIYINDIK